MSSDVTKRALSAGLGVGALALLAPRASADTPFSSFAFPATGAPTARTLPDRLGELKNVKDFGAKGNGVADDTAAIQAAFNQAAYAAVYFPPGGYRVTSPIRITGGPFGHYVYGAPAAIHANFDDYIFRFEANPGSQAFARIQGLHIANDSASTASGSILISEGQNCVVRECSFASMRNITFRACISSTVHNCWLRGNDPLGNRIPGSIGIFSGGHDPSAPVSGSVNISIQGCDFGGFYSGIRIQGAASVKDCRIEVCTYGVEVGKTENGGTFTSSAQLEHLEMEACGTFVSVDGVATLRFVGFQVDIGFSGAQDGGESQVGLLLGEWANVLVEMVGWDGPLRDAAIKFMGPVVKSTFIGVHGNLNPVRPGAVNWRGMELLDRSNITFIQCNNP
jgi:hypothetical protein